MKYIATFLVPGNPAFKGTEFDVTPEIEALGGAIPRADSNGTDLMQYAYHAPGWIKAFKGPFVIDIKEVA